MLIFECRLDKSDLSGFYFLRMTAVDTDVDAEDAVGVATAVEYDKYDVQAAASDVPDVVADVIEAVILMILWFLEMMKVLLCGLLISAQALLLIIKCHRFHPFFSEHLCSDAVILAQYLPFNVIFLYERYE